MGIAVSEGKNYTRLTASGNISVGAGLRAQLFGIFPAISSNATMAIQDSGNSNANITGNFSLTAGQFVPVPCAFTSGLVITLVGTCDVTVFWAPT